MYPTTSQTMSLWCALFAPLLLIATFVAPSLAATVDFEDVAMPPGTDSAFGGDRVSRGFLLDSPINHLHLDAVTEPVFRQQTH
jgi:hypothetical protein